MMGTSRETASTALKKMERAGIILRQKKRTIIADTDKLKKLALSHF
jgi:CRP-like cAMP-binding protein